jgi:hypothetical protein
MIKTGIYPNPDTELKNDELKKKAKKTVPEHLFHSVFGRKIMLPNTTAEGGWTNVDPRSCEFSNSRPCTKIKG